MRDLQVRYGKAYAIYNKHKLKITTKLKQQINFIEKYGMIY